MTKFYEFCGIGIYASFAVWMIRELKREVSQSASFGIFIVMLCFCLPLTGELVTFALSYTELVSQTCGDSIKTLTKALGITYISYISSEICKGAGEQGIASQLELAGRLEITLLCIPFFKKILDFALL